MSRFLGGSSTTNKTHAIELVNELDHDLSRASANVRPFKTQIESFDVVLNAHIPEEAGRTIAKLLEVGQPDIVFLENCKITDGHEVAERLDF